MKISGKLIAVVLAIFIAAFLLMSFVNKTSSSGKILIAEVFSHPFATGYIAIAYEDGRTEYFELEKQGKRILYEDWRKKTLSQIDKMLNEITAKGYTLHSASRSSMTPLSQYFVHFSEYTFVKE